MSQGCQIWRTPGSPLLIECSAELLRQVHREGSGERRGWLYGRRRDGLIHLLAARRSGHSRDLRLVGLERVGVFAVRSQGDVFLTERDLEFAERNGADLTLVLAGQQGGFFVPERDGSMVAIRSHREFAVPDAGTLKASGGKAGISAMLNAGALTACLVLSIAAALYAQPRAALTLRVHEEAGQLVAVWSPGVRGTLAIRDGMNKLQVPVSVQETRSTYEPEGRDVNIVLTTLEGMTREEQVHVRGQVASTPPLEDQIVKLEAERQGLIEEAEANRIKLGQLEKMLRH
jgi:hypothetical protein